MELLLKPDMVYVVNITVTKIYSKR